MGLLSVVMLLLLVLLAGTAADTEDVFSSTTDLARLVNTEQEFVERLSELADSLESEARQIREFLSEQYSELQVEDPVTYVRQRQHTVIKWKTVGI